VLKLNVWQAIVVGVVVLACVGYMGFTIARMFSRDADGPATMREARAFESGLARGKAPAGVAVFDGFSYRVPARFAGRIRLLVSDEIVSVTGPRAPKGAYAGWIWVQGILLALVPGAIALAAVKLDWRALLLAVGILVLNLGFSSLGAGIWPGMGEMDLLANSRFKAIEFERESVSAVKLGTGWADGGIDVVLLPVKVGIDGMAQRRAVSFDAPDENGRTVRYAVHLYSDAEASELYDLLGSR